MSFKYNGVAYRSVPAIHGCHGCATWPSNASCIPDRMLICDGVIAILDTDEAYNEYLAMRTRVKLGVEKDVP